MIQEREPICDQGQLPEQKVVRLKNPGNWCYANASINMLFACPGVVTFVKNCYTNPNRSPIIKELHELLMLKNNDIGSVEEILKIVSLDNPNFSAPQQQDAAEFITALLNCLYKSVQETEKQLFTDLFETQAEKKRTCTLSKTNFCQTVNNIDKYKIIALPIENSTSLEQCMTAFNGISETILVDCSNNCPSTNAEEITELKKIAKVLIVQFNRAYIDRFGNIKKNGCPVDIPLRFQPMHSGDWYKLTGIIQQKGEEATSGHYVTLTRNILDNNMNFILSNDDAPLVTRGFEDVAQDIKCSYIFIYTPEEFVQEARSILMDMTIEDPTSPLRKKNRQEEYSENEDEPVIDEACKKLIREYRNIEEQKDKEMLIAFY